MHLLPRLAFFAFTVAAVLAACDVGPGPDEPPIVITDGDPCPNGCEGPFVAVGSSVAGGAFCAPETAAAACDDTNPCTRDLCVAGACAHAASSACMGPGAFAFGRVFANGGVPAGASVAVDGDGTTVFAGAFLDAIDLGGGPIMGAFGVPDLFVGKIDALGHFVWGTSFPTSGGGAGPIAIAIGPSGEVVITGGFIGFIDLGQGPVGAGSDQLNAFVAKLDGNGKPIWGTSFPGTASSHGAAVAVDASGGVAITGNFTGALGFGDTLLNASGKNPTFVAGFDAAGLPTWATAFSDESYGPTYPGNRVAFDAAGNVVVAGSLLGTFDLGDGMMGTPGVPAAFVAKLDPMGALVWEKSFPAPEAAIAVQGVAVAPSGTILLAGSFQGTCDLGGGKLSTPISKDFDVFVAAYGADGAPAWSKRFGGDGDQPFCAIAADEAGDAILAGRFEGSIDFGAGPLKTKDATDADVFVAKLDSAGEPLWSKRFGDSQAQGAEAVAADAKGSVSVAGAARGSIDFGGGPLLTDAKGSLGIFVARFGP